MTSHEKPRPPIPEEPEATPPVTERPSPSGEAPDADAKLAELEGRIMPWRESSRRVEAMADNVREELGIGAASERAPTPRDIENDAAVDAFLRERLASSVHTEEEIGRLERALALYSDSVDRSRRIADLVREIAPSEDADPRLLVRFAEMIDDASVREAIFSELRERDAAYGKAVAEGERDLELRALLRQGDRASNEDVADFLYRTLRDGSVAHDDLERFRKALTLLPEAMHGRVVCNLLERVSEDAKDRELLVRVADGLDAEKHGEERRRAFAILARRGEGRSPEDRGAGKPELTETTGQALARREHGEGPLESRGIRQEVVDSLKRFFRSGAEVALASASVLGGPPAALVGAGAAALRERLTGGARRMPPGLKEALFTVLGIPIALLWLTEKLMKWLARLALKQKGQYFNWLDPLIKRLLAVGEREKSEKK